MSEKWIFGIYNSHELQSWAKRLRYFRFIYDPQVNSGREDSLELKLEYNSTEQYLDHLQKLGLTPEKMDANCIEPNIGQGYSLIEAKKFQFEIADVKGYRQTRITKIKNEFVFLWAHIGVLNVKISGPICCPCEINEEEIKSAERIESVFDSVKQHIIDPPSDSEYCVCPKYYPSWFA